MKRMTAFALAVLIIINLLATPTLAVGDNEIQPRFTYIATVGAKLVIDDRTGVATCTGSLQTYSSHKLKITCRLQRLNAGTWITVSSWTEQVDNKLNLIITRSCIINPENQYRVSVFAYVYDGDTFLEATSKIAS
jgi:hypothetical protein